MEEDGEITNYEGWGTAVAGDDRFVLWFIKQGAADGRRDMAVARCETCGHPRAQKDSYTHPHRTSDSPNGKLFAQRCNVFDQHPSSG
jgi:hypothetical protein